MKQYINKDILVAEIEKLRKNACESFQKGNSTEEQYYIRYGVIQDILSFLVTLEVKDPYEQCVQYDSIKTGIQAHAEIYSFNIESMLFPQLTKEQQKLWRKEIEQAVISGGEAGVELARDHRYKENLEVKEINSTDAFIEKAYEFFDEHLWEYINVKANCDTFINIDVDKFKDDFKNYIKKDK